MPAQGIQVPGAQSSAENTATYNLTPQPLPVEAADGSAVPIVRRRVEPGQVDPLEMPLAPHDSQPHSEMGQDHISLEPAPRPAIQHRQPDSAPTERPAQFAQRAAETPAVQPAMVQFQENSPAVPAPPSRSEEALPPAVQRRIALEQAEPLEMPLALPDTQAPGVRGISTKSNAQAGSSEPSLLRSFAGEVSLPDGSQQVAQPGGPSIFTEAAGKEPTSAGSERAASSPNIQIVPPATAQPDLPRQLNLARPDSMPPAARRVQPAEAQDIRGEQPQSVSGLPAGPAPVQRSPLGVQLPPASLPAASEGAEAAPAEPNELRRKAELSMPVARPPESVPFYRSSSKAGDEEAPTVTTGPSRTGLPSIPGLPSVQRSPEAPTAPEQPAGGPTLLPPAPASPFSVPFQGRIFDQEPVQTPQALPESGQPTPAAPSPLGQQSRISMPVSRTAVEAVRQIRRKESVLARTGILRRTASQPEKSETLAPTVVPPFRQPAAPAVNDEPQNSVQRMPEAAAPQPRSSNSSRAAEPQRLVYASAWRPRPTLSGVASIQRSAAEIGTPDGGSFAQSTGTAEAEADSNQTFAHGIGQAMEASHFEAASREIQRIYQDAPVVDVSTPEKGIQRSVSSFEDVAPAEEAAPSVDLRSLARQIYPLIKRMLAVERERTIGRTF
jgi:hypothetical protein